MRILFLNRYSISQTKGGVAEYLHYLPKHLKKLGVECFIYHESDHTDLVGPEPLENGMQAFSGPFVTPRFWVTNRNLKPLLTLCEQYPFDFIHAQGVYRPGFVARELHKRTKIPYIITSHADIIEANSERMRRPKVRKRCQKILNDAKAALHLTPLMADISHKVCDTRDKSFIIGNGIDTKEWQAYQDLPENQYVLGMGRFVHEKGFHILIEAYQKARALGVETSLVLGGAGPEEAALHAQAEKTGYPVVYGLPDVNNIPKNSIVFPGYVRGDNKRRLMAQCKLILFPTQTKSWEEAFSIMQLESIAAGRYMLASDSLPTRYLQSLGLQAELVKDDDPNAWAHAIKNILANDSERLYFAKKNYFCSLQFDWDLIAGRYLEMYRGLKA